MGNKRRCPYCGEFSRRFHSCSARKRAFAPTSGGTQQGLWTRLFRAVKGENRVREGADPDRAANRHRRVNEGGVFPWSTTDSAIALHAQFRRRRLPIEVGQNASVRIYEGNKKGRVVAIDGDNVTMEFPPRRPGEAPRVFDYPRKEVFPEFDPSDISTRTIRPKKDPKDLGIIRKGTRVSVAYYDRDVEGTVSLVRGNIVEFVADGENRIRQTSADICSILPDVK